MSNSPGLWPAIEEHTTTSSLSLLLSTKYPVEKTGGLPTYVLGINASSCVYEVQLCYTIPRAAQSPELGMLFSRLARFPEAPLISLFVFDGPDCPGPDCFEERQWQHVTKRTHALTAGLRQLVAAFGFPIIWPPPTQRPSLPASISKASSMPSSATTCVRCFSAHKRSSETKIYSVIGGLSLYTTMDNAMCTDPSPLLRGALLLRTLTTVPCSMYPSF